MNDEINPFSSPPEVDHVVPAPVNSPSVLWAVPYRSAGLRAKLSMTILAGIAILNLVCIWSTYRQIDLLQRIAASQRASRDVWSRDFWFVGSDRQFTQEEIVDNDDRQKAIGWMARALGLASAVFFLMWFHRAYRNLPSLGAARMRFTPGAAVGWWFAPGFNFVYPCAAMSDIWKGSDPTVVENGRVLSRQGLRLTLVLSWWLLWVTNSLGGIAIAAMAPGVVARPNLAALITFSWALIGACSLSVVSATFTIAMIHRTTANQEKRIRLLDVLDPLGDEPGTSVD